MMQLLFALLLCPASIEMVFVSKYNKIQVKASSWERVKEIIPRDNRESCGYSAKRHLGYGAFAFNGTAETCERAEPTCARPEGEGDSKQVYMSSVTTEYLGCYQDYANARNLPVSKGLNILTLTPDLCVLYCSQNGMEYSGTIAGKQCWCGDERPMDKNKKALASCNAKCLGDNTQTCGGNGMQQVYHTFNTKVPFWKQNQADREEWQLSGTAPIQDLYPLENIIDGKYQLGNSYWSSDRLHPWVQIQLESSQLVKGLQIRSQANVPQRIALFEVRVGDSEAVSTNPKNPDYNKMCHNKLCFTTGREVSGTLGAYIDQDCVAPLTGKYVTIQRYAFQAKNSLTIQVEEVEVIIYCQGSLPTLVCPEPEPNEDCSAEELPVTYMGCYYNHLPPSFPTSLGARSTNTPLDCARACKENDPANNIIGLSNINRCYCGVEANLIESDTPQTGCQFNCPGDYSYICGWNDKKSVYRIDNNAVPVEVWLKTADEKQDWSAKSSSVKPGGSFAASFAIDGTHANIETNLFMSDPEDAYPWIQVDLGSSLLLKRIKIQGMTNCCPYKAMPHLEIRVGDIDVSTKTLPGRRICENKVCHTTGPSQLTDSSFDCTVLRRGRYVSVQRHRQWHSGTHGTEWGWQMAISEIDVDYVDNNPQP